MSPPRSLIPWMVPAIALAALVVLVGAHAIADDDESATGGAAWSTPDISQIAPDERARRLYRRVMSLAAEGKRDSVVFFAPMALAAFDILGPLNADQRRQREEIGAAAEAAVRRDAR